MIELPRRTAIAVALAQAGERGVSGEALAEQLGISRVAVNKQVNALRALGYRIHSAPHLGYRLLETPDLCMPETVAPLLTDPLWRACEGGAEVGSTNTEAKALAAAGAPEGTVVVAARQRAGRGRFGRVWESPGGGAYVSCVLRPPVAPVATAPLSLVVAVGASRALAALGVPVRLKWPNDLQADGRKLGGILLEMSAEADRVEWVVVGCGVNVAPGDSEGAACVREFAPEARVAEVAARVLDGIAAAYAEYLHFGFSAMHAEYEARLVLLGRQVVGRDAFGGEIAQGEAIGIAPDGSLILRTAAGDVHLRSGEVTLRG